MTIGTRAMWINAIHNGNYGNNNFLRVFTLNFKETKVKNCNVLRFSLQNSVFFWQL